MSLLFSKGIMNILTYIFGNINNYFITFIIIIIIEYLTSIINLAISKSITKSLIIEPFIKYFYYFILIIIANVLDIMLSTGNEEIKTCLVFFYMSLEIMIILNNSSKMGIPIPKKLVRIVKILNDDNKKEMNQDENKYKK